MVARRFAPGMAVGLALVLFGSAVVASPTDPTGGPSDPSATGPYAVHSVTIATNVAGQSSTLEVWLPHATGPRPAVIVNGGWGMSAASYTGIAQHLASRGFAAGLFQQPSVWSTSTPSWASQLRGAIDALAASNAKGALQGRIDMDHLGLVGHSYGGAAVVWEAADDPRVKTVVALAPVNQSNWSGVTAQASALDAPILVIAADWDVLSIPSFYTKPLYESCTQAFAREYVEVSGSHMVPSYWTPGSAPGEYGTAWLERFLASSGDPAGWTTGARASRDGSLIDRAASGHAPPSASTSTASTPTASTPASTSPTLSEGSTGADVVALQDALSAAGCSPGASDGDFGPMTKAAVEQFQAAHGLAVDGIVGPATRAALGL